MLDGTRTIAAALCLAAALAAAGAPDPCPGCGALPHAHAARTATIATSTATATIQGVLDGLESGGVVTFASGTHSDLGEIIVSKPMVLEGAPGAVISGDTTLRIQSSEATVRDLTFDRITRAANSRGQVGDHEVISVGMWRPDNRDLHDIEISNNTITNPVGHGIRIIDDRSTITNLRITGNVIKHVGTPYPDGYTVEQKAGRLLTAIRTAEHGLFRNLFISGNTIDTATFAGINVGASGIVNGHIGGNSISNMPAFAIQKAVERTHDAGTPDARKLAGPGAGLGIYGNTITGANNSLRYLDGRHESVPEAAIIIWGADDSNTRIYGNAVRQSHNGILLCVDVCGVQDTRRGELLERFRVADTPIDQSVVVFGNSFEGNTGYDLINLAPSPMLAPFNYWGGDIAGRISGNVQYSPYVDAGLTVLAEAPRRQLGAGAQSPSCSVSVEGPAAPLRLAGGERGAAVLTVTNAGTEPVSGLIARAGPWIGSDGAEHSGLDTSARAAGRGFADLDPGEFARLPGSGLPAPGSALEIELRVVRDGGAPLPARLGQSVHFLAGCR